VRNLCARKGDVLYTEERERAWERERERERENKSDREIATSRENLCTKKILDAAALVAEGLIH
jgi:hypothetical protein